MGSFFTMLTVVKFTLKYDQSIEQSLHCFHLMNSTGRSPVLQHKLRNYLTLFPRNKQFAFEDNFLKTQLPLLDRFHQPPYYYITFGQIVKTPFPRTNQSKQSRTLSHQIVHWTTAAKIWMRMVPDRFKHLLLYKKMKNALIRRPSSNSVLLQAMTESRKTICLILKS